MACGFEEAKRETAASGGVHDQLRRQDLASPADVLEPDGDDRCTIRCSHDVLSAAAIAERDVGVLPYAPSPGAFDQRSGHRISDPPEVALGERIITGSLDADVETDPQRHRTSRGEVLLKSWKEIAERALTAAEQRVDVLGLRRACAVRRVRRQGVTLQHDHMFEVVGECPRRSQAGHPGADHDRLPADQCGRHQSSPFFLAHGRGIRLNQTS